MNSESYTQAVDGKYVTRVTVGDSFNTVLEVLRHSLDDEAAIQDKGTFVDKMTSALPKYSLTAKRRDTSVGGNDAVNCYYQFCENDDIVHPINRTGIKQDDGMGRVYNETFDEQQQIIYMSFGLPDFMATDKFLENVYNTDLATLMNAGESPGVLQTIAKYIGKAVGYVIFFPIIPIKFLIDVASNFSTPTKFYDFRPEPALYYKIVNSILAHLAVNMDLAPMEQAGESFYNAGQPELLQKHGVDILTILSRKAFYDKLASSKDSPNTDEMFKRMLEAGQSRYDEATDNAGWNFLKSAIVGAEAGVSEAFHYVGFRVEKSVDSSESASNSTKAPDILNTVNSGVSSARERVFNLSGLKETQVGEALSSVYDVAMAAAKGTLDTVGLAGGLELLKGSGYIDIPEMWENSSFAKSYSFNFQLRTPMGDKFSIFYSLYIPLAMLIAGAFPRSTGQNSYTSPFLIRAYCQGMFAIPLGIIDSITITRGASEYGWSVDRLPTKIDISFTIKDLSPIMAVAISQGGLDEWMNIFGQNSNFQEYMLTLSGVNVGQRTARLGAEAVLIKRRAEALLTILSNNKFNPLMVGFSLGTTKVGRAITRFWPGNRLPGNIPLPQG